jgi:MerR family transcriptional regulator, heat shock protein HspR
MSKAKRELEFTGDILKKDMPLYTIGVVSEVIGTTNQTLRLYEKHGLIKPARKNKNRLYSDNDVRWLLCLRELIHKKKFGIEGIKKLLEYASCYEITECPPNRKNECRAYIDRTKPCWELNRTFCFRKPSNGCEQCVVFLSKNKKKPRDNGKGKGF